MFNFENLMIQGMLEGLAGLIQLLFTIVKECPWLILIFFIPCIINRKYK